MPSLSETYVRFINALENTRIEYFTSLAAGLKDPSRSKQSFGQFDGHA